MTVCETDRMTTARLGVTAAAAGLAVVMLTSCAAPASEAPPAVAPSVEASSPAPLEPPAAAFDLSCDDLVSPEQMTAVWGEALRKSPGYPLTATPSGLLDAALLHNGGLFCAWSGSAQDETVLTITVLPDAAEAFAVAVDALAASTVPPTEAPLADRAVVECSDAYEWLGVVCAWNAQRGDVWLYAAANFLPSSEVTVPSPRDNPDSSRKPLVPTTDDSLMAAIVEGALDAVVDASRVEVPRPAAPAPTCEELFAGPTAVALLDGRVVQGGRVVFGVSSVEGTNRLTQGAMGPASADRLGYTRCVVGDGPNQPAVIVGVAPEADWIFDQQRYLAPTAVEQVGDVTVWCVEYSCSAMATNGDSLLTAETSTGEIPVEEARAAAVEAVQAMLDSLR